MSCLPEEQTSRFDNGARDGITPESRVIGMEVTNKRIAH